MIYPIAVILIVASLDTVKSEKQWKTVYLPEDSATQFQTAIPHSFERTAIQFKTDNDDNDKFAHLDLDFYVGKERQGGFTVLFHTNPGQADTYNINQCQEESTESLFPENMPTEAEKLWSILVTTGAQPSFKVQVNGVEVINVLLTDDTCAYANWRLFWTKEIDLLKFESWQEAFIGYHLDSCYWGHYLDADADCQECPADHWSADAGDTACTPCPAGTHVGAGLGLAESDCTGNGDETEHNYSQSVAHKLSALLVVLLFALNMNI